MFLFANYVKQITMIIEPQTTYNFIFDIYEIQQMLDEAKESCFDAVLSFDKQFEDYGSSETELAVNDWVGFCDYLRTHYLRADYDNLVMRLTNECSIKFSCKLSNFLLSFSVQCNLQTA